jgi:hypothetical protein
VIRRLIERFLSWLSPYPCAAPGKLSEATQRRLVQAHLDNATEQS